MSADNAGHLVEDVPVLTMIRGGRQADPAVTVEGHDHTVGFE